MLRQLRIFTFYLAVGLFSVTALAVDDLELAESLIEQDDCENALPILVTIYKSPDSDKKRTLLSINKCAEKNLNYTLKESTEKKLLQMDPKDQAVQLRYLDSLFYLSKYQDLIAFSKKKRDLYFYDDYWMLLGRSLYEINESEKSISAFETYLKKKVTKKRDEAYYWMIKNYIQIEEYGDAREYLTKLAEMKEIAPWLKDKIGGLQEFIELKDKRFSLSAKIQGGTDNNILRTHDRISDTTTLVDLYMDYKLINKTKNTLTLGLDINYQGYSQFTDVQTAAVAPRIGQSFDVTSTIRGEYLISVGKSQTNFKADQNYYFVSNYYYIPVSASVELQPTLTYFENLNNNPVKQVNVSLLANFYFQSSFFWLGPYYAESSSPPAEIDSVTYTVPVVTNYSLTTRYSKMGLIAGYQFSLGEDWSILAQYSLGQTKYKSPDLSTYDSTQVDSFDDRIDLNQSGKLSIGYRQSNQWRYNLSFGYITNNSKGFAGFNSGAIPDNNYHQTQALFGISYRTP